MLPTWLKKSKPATSPNQDELPRPSTPQPCLLRLPKGEYRCCDCGQAQQPPLCKPHAVCNGRRFVVKAAEETVWLCTCKASRTLPFCDGSHNKLSSG